LKDEKAQEASASSGLPRDVIELVFQQAQAAPLPSGEEERRTFFMTLVQQGDSLLAMGTPRLVYLQSLVLTVF